MKKRTIGEIKSIANQRNGKCLSKVYKNNYTKLRWECEFGHQWNAMFHSIYRYDINDWCSYCRKPKVYRDEKTGRYCLY